MRPVESAQREVDKRCPKCGASYPHGYKVCPRDGAVLELPQAVEDDPLIGDVLGGSFCIVGVVGEGGMGRVYAAEHVRLPRKLAVKVVAVELATNAEALARMEREAQAAATVVHPNVLEVIDVVRCRDGRPCLVTELLEGEELGAVLEQRRPVSALEAVDICRQACRALAAAHAKGIVHRDIKPENLFLCRPEPDGPPVVKVLDFGVAKMTDGANLTRLGTVVGTPAYMAPEQARGGPGVDARADVYGIAAVLYHLLTGTRPFDDEDPARALARVVTEVPRRMSEINPAIPKDLEAIVARAMEKDPAKRTASARALEHELAGFVKSVEERIASRAAEKAVEERLATKARAEIAPASAAPAFAIRARSAPEAEPWIPVGAGVAAAAVVGLLVREIAGAIASHAGPMPTVDVLAVVLGAGAGLGAFVGLTRAARPR